MNKRIIVINHPEGSQVGCEMPKCENKTVHPLKFCASCQAFVEKVDYAARLLGYINPNY